MIRPLKKQDSETDEDEAMEIDTEDDYRFDDDNDAKSQHSVNSGMSASSQYSNDANPVSESFTTILDLTDKLRVSLITTNRNKPRRRNLFGRKKKSENGAGTDTWGGGGSSWRRFAGCVHSHWITRSIKL